VNKADELRESVIRFHNDPAAMRQARKLIEATKPQAAERYLNLRSSSEK